MTAVKKDLEKIIEDNYRFIYQQALKIIRKYNLDYTYLNDLVQQGIIGLLRAYERYDKSKGVKLLSYASHYILAEMQEIIPIARTPLSTPSSNFTSKKHIDDDGNIIMRGSNISELKKAGLDNISKKSLSLSSIISGTDDITLEETLKADLEDIDEKIFKDELKAEILNIMDKYLNKREKEILIERYNLNNNDNSIKSYEEIGKKFNLSRERVRQIEAKALRKLRIIMIKKYPHLRNFAKEL